MKSSKFKDFRKKNEIEKNLLKLVAFRVQIRILAPIS